MTDNKYVRASVLCPICLGTKDRGLVACWSCYKQYDLRNGNLRAEQKILEMDMRLEELARDSAKSLLGQ